jgi:prepilin-type N-terminal cleavage/methylation domain-containing protein/prepilin-type processing-associated H-X9-DG protein
MSDLATHAPTAPRRQAARGFTLVELLVVIGIIAVLIGILLPALNKARKSSRTLACLSNVRQLTISMIQYWQENKGFTPYYNKGKDDDGNNQIDQREWMAQVVRPSELNKVRLCPEATEYNPAYANNLTQNMPGAAFACWGPGGQALQDPINKQPLTGSYCYNGYLIRKHGSGNDHTLAGGGQANDPVIDPQVTPYNPTAPGKLWTYPLFQKTTFIPVIMDGTWDSAWPKETDAPPANLYSPAGGPPMAIGNNWTRVCMARHNMAINVSFADGHAETVDLPNLWNLRWHSQWDTRKFTFNTIKSIIKSEYHGS